MNFSLYIAKRYLFSKSGTNAINIISFIAGFGVIIATSALFIILSGFSGLRTFSDTLLEAYSPDIKILPLKGKSFQFTESTDKKIGKIKAVQTYSKVVEERVSLKYLDKNHIAYIKGVDQSYNQVVKIDSALNIGTWLDKAYKNTAVIGAGISYKLSLGAFNFSRPMQITVPKSGTKFIANINSAFNTAQVQITGIYTGSEEFENKYVFTNISLAKELLNFSENQVTAIEVKIDKSFNSNQVKEQLEQSLGKNFTVKTKKQLNALYYKVVNTENFVSYLIFTLIIAIALFNVIGSVIMLVIDKRKNLKTLLNLGSSVRQIKQIFVFQGFLLVMIGMLVGLLIGGLMVFIQLHFDVFMISTNLAYPVEFTWINLWIVVLTLVLLGYIASKIASSRITKNFIENS
ncbi:MAG: ABC transporter permease [Tenacibaculum sp.]